MLYSQGKSPLESAGKKSLQSTPYSNDISDQPNYARNIKGRLFEQPETRDKDASKDAYRRELQRQMEDVKRRKLEEKRKAEEEDLKYERQFYQSRNKQAPQAHATPKKEEPGFIGRSAQRNRSTSDREQTSPVVNPANHNNNTPAHVNSIPKLQFAHQQHTSLRDLRDMRNSPQAKENAYRSPLLHMAMMPAEDEYRMIHFSQFQESMIKKMEDLRSQISKSKSSFDFGKELTRIRGMMKSKDSVIQPLLLESNNSQVEHFYQLKHETNHLKIRGSTPHVPDTFSKLEGKTEVRYEHQDEQITPITNQQSPESNLFESSRGEETKRVKSESSHMSQEQELYDHMEMPQAPPPQFNFSKKVTHWTKEAPKKDLSFQASRPIQIKEVKAGGSVDTRIDAMLGNIDNLIQNYDRD